MTDLTELEAELLAAVAGAGDLAGLDAVRVQALGKQGSISGLLKSLGAMSPEDRKAKGPEINSLRDRISTAIFGRKAELEALELERRLTAERVDLSLPSPPRRKGSVHPTMQVMDEVTAIFAELGFAVAEGPDIEDDFHNFTALNFPPKHPAREMHDTFFFNPGPDGERKLLRTHTSPVQVRTMLANGAPVRIIAPGRVYRSDSDATHTPMFHQVEGLVIDRNIHLGHLKWTLETFLKAFFEREDIVLRLRPSYFPFTEPSIEVDVGFALENGKRVLGGSGDAPGHGWMELLGSGMVNRKVIEMSGLDPGEWQGFAFGVGVDRLAMLKYGMDDLRAFFDGDVRWLRHYGFSPFDQPTLSAGVGARA
jgi:phenylalanyl-tRNA synthetase alpha chain